MTTVQFQIQQLDNALDVCGNDQLLARLGLDASNDSYLLE